MPENNPLYVGYYPGDKPINKKGVGRPQKPTDPVDWVGFDAFTAELENDLNLPLWAKDRIIADVKSSFKAQIKPKDVSAEQLDIYGEEATQAYPGAFGISISLNPYDWQKDFSGQAVKTLKGWFNAAADWNDLESQKRRYIWDLMLSDPKSTATLENLAKGVLAENLILSSAGASATNAAAVALSGRANPLSLDGLGITALSDDGKRYEDVYYQYKLKLLDFQLNSGNAIFREDKYDGVVMAGAKALVNDFRTNTGAAPLAVSAMTGFEEKYKFTKLVGDLNFTSQGPYGVSAALDKANLTGDYGSLTKSLLDFTDPATGNVTSGYITQLQNKITAINNFTFTDPNTRAELAHIIEPLQNKLTQMEALVSPGGALTNLAAMEPSNIGRLFVAQAKRSLDSVAKGGFVGDGLGGGDSFVDGYHRRLVRHLDERIRKDMGSFVKNDTKAGYIVLATLTGSHKDRLLSATGEFGDQALGGSFMNSYVWQRVKNKANVLTPAYWTAKALASVHYFGLIMQDEDSGLIYSDGVYDVIKVGFFKIRVRSDTAGQGFSKLFVNKFNLTITHAGRNIKAAITAGGQFETIAALGVLHKRLALSDDALKYLLSPGVVGGGVTATVFAEFNRLNGGLLFTEKGLGDIVSKLDAYKKWVVDNHALFGLTPAQAADPQFMRDLLLALHEKGLDPSKLSITKKYVGVLERVAASINIGQTAILNTWPMRQLRSIIALKQALFNSLAVAYKTASQAVLRFLQGLLAGASGGTLAFLAPIIEAIWPWLEKLGYFIFGKIVNIASGVLVAVFKGDFSKLLKEWNKSLDAMVKVILYVLGIPLVLILSITLMFSGAVLTSIPPANPASSGSVYGGPGGIGLPPGDDTFNPNCSLKPWEDSQALLSLARPSGTIAGRSFDIVNNLRQGFWCYWNYSPDYPQFFDRTEFALHPNRCVYRENFPTGCTGDHNKYLNIFWCTQLVVSTYTESGNGFGNILGAHAMADNFKSRNKFLEPTTDVRGNITPGDVLFTHTQGDTNWIGHVAVVHSVAQDYIITIDSNSSRRSHTFTIGTDGRVQSQASYLIFAGIGRQ